MLKLMADHRARGAPAARSGFVKIFELLVIVMIFLVSNRRAWYCFFVLDSTEYYCEYGTASTDFLWWGVTALGILLLLAQKGLMKEYLAGWKASWPLLVFILYSSLSLTWTIDINRSFHAVYVLIAASLSAAGLAIMYSREKIFRLLLWFAGLTALASLIAVILFPKAAITQIFYLAGTWRGVFSHKNYMGSVMAFANGLFLYSFLRGYARYPVAILSAVFYLLTLFLVVMSQSATGLITLILLNGLTLGYFAWLKWGKFLHRKHYVWLAALSAFTGAAVLLNLKPLLALIGKSPGLTGRVPLWQYLLQEVVSKRPWLGYGPETLWYERAFQVASGEAAGWGMIVVNSHSGYMDILVYLGVIGLTIFSGVVIQAVVRALRSALRAAASTGFLPLLVLAYVLVANTTISYFLEFESFHWVLLVLVLFIRTSSQDLNLDLGASKN